ncbi:MAG: efflux RND transporter periplasmic adaptor subunit [Deltaproteobacteria bacterium]|jgi:RND family efflux transporter MFP subunit|nr:efflux RND transporter periplasmic adaptor subunit [Deltaproteobacteria bacterium]
MKTTRNLILVAALAAVGCKKEQAKPEPVIRPVRILKVEASGGEQLKRFSGVSEAGLESRLSFKVAGTIRKLEDKVGTKLKKGAVIAEIDSSDYELQVQTARATAASASAQVRRAKSEYDRTQQLFTNQNASRSQLEAARAAYETARANSAATSKQVQLARQQLSYTRLTSPVDGVIAKVHVEVNENVGAGAPVVSISSGSKPKVTVTVPDKLFGQIKTGDSVDVHFEAIPGASYRAVVSEVAVQSGRGGAPVTAVIDEPDDKVKPGLAATVIFKFGSKDDQSRIVVPPVAVAEDRNGRYGFVFEPGQDGLGTVKRVPLEVGELSDQGIEISKGLAVGQLVVTAGVTRLTDGMTVRAPAELPAATAEPDESKASPDKGASEKAN